MTKKTAKTIKHDKTLQKLQKDKKRQKLQKRDKVKKKINIATFIFHKIIPFYSSTSNKRRRCVCIVLNNSALILSLSSIIGTRLGVISWIINNGKRRTGKYAAKRPRNELLIYTDEGNEEGTEEKETTLVFEEKFKNIFFLNSSSFSELYDLFCVIYL